MRFMHIICCLLIAVITACTPTDSSPETSLRREPVDTAIDDAVARGVYPFLYVRVEKFDGSLVYEHAAVNPDFVKRIPTGDSWMRIWSMSKSLTIAAILDMEEDGLLSRADPVTKYIPEFADLMMLSAEADSTSCDEDLTPPNRPITIEDLLNHNDGFYYPFTEYECPNDAMRQARRYLNRAVTVLELLP